MVFTVGRTGGSRWTACTLGMQESEGDWAGHSIWTGALHACLRLPGVTVEPLSTAPTSGGLISWVTVSSLRVTAPPSAVTGFTGAEGSLRRIGTSEAWGAPLTELTLVSRRAAAALHPAGRSAAATRPGWPQPHVVKVTTSWGDTTVQSNFPNVLCFSLSKTWQH